jgi:hypothetical protein
VRAGDPTTDAEKRFRSDYIRGKSPYLVACIRCESPLPSRGSIPVFEDLAGFRLGWLLYLQPTPAPPSQNINKSPPSVPAQLSSPIIIPKYIRPRTWCNLHTHGGASTNPSFVLLPPRSAPTSALPQSNSSPLDYISSISPSDLIASRSN